MNDNPIEWDEARGRYVNRALEAVQARHRLASLIRNTIVEHGDLPTVITATLESTPATIADVVAALVLAAQEAGYNGGDEAEQVRTSVTDLLTAWLVSAVRA